MKSIQEAYGVQALNLAKAAVTRWLSHGAACKHCWERHHIIIEVLGDIITTSSNPEVVACRDALLETATVCQTTFLEDVLIWQKKDFSATSHSKNMVLGTLKVMGANRETKYLKNFNNADKII